MIVPDRERCPQAGRHFEEEVSEGSFGAGRLMAVAVGFHVVLR